jgi:hypothetical protein
MKMGHRKFMNRSDIVVALTRTGLLLFLIGAIIILKIYTAWTVSSETPEIFFRSWESKTLAGGPVYNTIKLIKKKNLDIWMMNQSHHGSSPNPEQIDRLAIVVRDQVASFYQLEPGPLSWTDEILNRKIDLKVNCIQCHSNGPRVIRAAPDFKSLLSVKQNINLFILNLKIKFYGKIKNQLWMHKSEIDLGEPQKALNIKVCMKCHNGGKTLFGRSILTLQNRETIKFLLNENQMPPPGFSISEGERRELENRIGL